jgi:LacI family transcriptional regulator
MTETNAKTPTIQDIAREAGVSAATVSRVINGTRQVEPIKRQRVLDVIEHHQYRPNPFARSLLQKTSRTIGALVPQLEDEFYGKIITGLESELRTHGFHVMVSLGHDDETVEVEALEAFRERQVDGLILMTQRLSDAALLNLSRQRVPIVLVNRQLPELEPHCVRLDNVSGGAQATRHLLGLGHRRIAHITGNLQRLGSRERLEGYRQAMHEAGLPRDEQLVVEGDFTEESGQAATQRLLARGAFSAIFAASDRLAVGAFLALHKAGLDVPKDVSVVGFDDRSIASFVIPGLTTMHYPMLEMGVAAGRHLISLVRGETPAALHVFEPGLIVRGSSAAVKR